MASKPKEKDYGPSDTEKMQASIAAADAAYFQKTYDPLLANLIQLRLLEVERRQTLCKPFLLQVRQRGTA